MYVSAALGSLCRLMVNRPPSPTSVWSRNQRIWGVGFASNKQVMISSFCSCLMVGFCKKCGALPSGILWKQLQRYFNDKCFTIINLPYVFDNLKNICSCLIQSKECMTIETYNLILKLFYILLLKHELFQAPTFLFQIFRSEKTHTSNSLI